MPHFQNCSKKYGQQNCLDTDKSAIPIRLLFIKLLWPNCFIWYNKYRPTVIAV